MQIGREWLRTNLGKAVFVSRFLPGARLPTYTACGFFGAGFRHFALVAILATLIWTSLLFMVSLRVGQALIDHLGQWRWVGMAGFALTLVLIGRILIPSEKRCALSGTAMPADPASVPHEENAFSLFERWPGWLFYAPIVLHWFWHGICAGDMSLPTAANPGIETGGLCGESKSAILDSVREASRRLIAPYLTL